MNDPRQVTSIHTTTQIDRTSLDAHITRTFSPCLPLSLPISLSYTYKVFERIKKPDLMRSVEIRTKSAYTHV